MERVEVFLVAVHYSIFPFPASHLFNCNMTSSALSGYIEPQPRCRALAIMVKLQLDPLKLKLPAQKIPARPLDPDQCHSSKPPTNAHRVCTIRRRGRPNPGEGHPLFLDPPFRLAGRFRRGASRMKSRAQQFWADGVLTRRGNGWVTLFSQHCR